jgi:hypothetical protein
MKWKAKPEPGPLYPGQNKEPEMEQKPKRMRKILLGVGKVAKGIVKGVFDVALPNIKNTIRVKEPDLPEEKKKFEIDFPRLITAITIWILLVLVFFGKIKLSDVVLVIEKLVPLK